MISCNWKLIKILYYYNYLYIMTKKLNFILSARTNTSLFILNLPQRNWREIFLSTEPECVFLIFFSSLQNTYCYRASSKLNSHVCAYQMVILKTSYRPDVSFYSRVAAFRKSVYPRRYNRALVGHKSDISPGSSFSV